jgi:GcrA cell cycle regulator
MKRDNKPNVVWTADLIDRVSTLWRQGISAKDIARLVKGGLTKNGVIGRMHRMDIDPGLPPSGRRWRTPTHPRGVQRPVKARPPRPSRAKHAPPAASLPLPVPEPPPKPKPPPRPPKPPRRMPPGGWTLLDLESEQCKWPLNSPPRGGEYLFCGERAFDSGPYCEYHAQLGFSGKGTARRTEVAGWMPRPVEFGR